MPSQFRITRDLLEIEDLLNSRLPVSRLPENWIDERFSSLTPHDRHTLINDIEVHGGKSTFGNRDVNIQISSGERLTLGVGNKTAELALQEVNFGYRNISVGGVSVAEHPASLKAGLGLQAQIRLDASSFPQFEDGLGPIIDKLADNLVKVGKIEPLKVSKPVAVIFNNGSYVIAEPPRPIDPEGVLVLDNQFSHRRNALGNLRMQIGITPERYAFLARARTPTYGWRSNLLRLISGELGFSLPGLGMNLKNTVIAGRKALANPKKEFDFPKGAGNGEAMAHECIDKLGSVMWAFIGRLTFRATNHRKDIIAMREIEKELTTV